MASSMDNNVIELELCPNCKKEIPQVNYVMHTAHCARNIAVCPICKESVPKAELETHRQRHEKAATTTTTKTKTRSTQLGTSVNPSQTTTWKSKPYTGPFPEKLGHGPTSKSNGVVGAGGSRLQQQPQQSKTTTTAQSATKTKHNDLSACPYCELELPKDTLKEHQDYCGTRTDKCIECGEFVMYKYKKLHEESNHGFVKLSDEPGPRPTWDSSTERTAHAPTQTTRAPRRTHSFDMSSVQSTLNFNMNDYIPPSLTAQTQVQATSTRYTDPEDVYRPSGSLRNQAKADYKDMSRRLDCKTEYIRNLLHDSASITAPLRTAATQPRNHFNHQKGQAPPPPPAYRRPNPPTELTIPCEFCDTPIPHEELIQHETGCRPDLARFNPRRRRQEEEFYRYTPSPPPPPPEVSSPEVELPCEFCSDMIPASQLLRHQATCT